MPNYPNDPGPDKGKRCEGYPVNEYTFVTTDVFAAAIETQTRYSYECSKQLAEKSIIHTNKIAEDLDCRIGNLNASISNLGNSTEAGLNDVRCYIKKVQVGVINVAKKVENITNEMSIRMNNNDRQMLLRSIMDLA